DGEAHRRIGDGRERRGVVGRGTEPQGVEQPADGTLVRTGAIRERPQRPRQAGDDACDPHARTSCRVCPRVPSARWSDGNVTAVREMWRALGDLLPLLPGGARLFL